MNESEIEEILSIIQNSEDGISRSEIKEKLSFEISGSTLYRRLITQVASY
jgi:hypothetical protein